MGGIHFSGLLFDTYLVWVLLLLPPDVRITPSLMATQARKRVNSSYCIMSHDKLISPFEGQILMGHSILPFSLPRNPQTIEITALKKAAE